MKNRHPVDRLADVRAQIKTLQEEEKDLRSELGRPGADLKGDEYEAAIERKSSARLDRKKFEERYGRKALDGLMSSSEFNSIKLWRRVERPETSLQDDIDDKLPF